MSRTYPQVYAGEWVHIQDPSNYKWSCCDCGLVHKFDIAIVHQIEPPKGGLFLARDLPGPERKKLQVIMRAWRDNRATAQIRRHRDSEDKP